MTGAEPDVVVVGAGPAGLAAALALAEADVKRVVIIDRDDAPGGLPRFCGHPGFGWEYARKLMTGPGFVRYMLERLARHSVEILLRTTMISMMPGPAIDVVGPALGFKTLKPKAMVIATGIRESNRGNRLIVGARPEHGVVTTGQLQQLIARRVGLPNGIKRLTVVGTEHVAFSAIWTARGAGLSVSAMAENEDRVMSFAPVGWLARAAGIQIILGCNELEIEGDARQVTALLARCDSGTRRISCDGVVFTAGWIPEVAAFGESGPELDPGSGGPIVDQALRTSLPGVFAAGNVLHPVETSGWSALEGRCAGQIVAMFLAQTLPGAQGELHINPGPGVRYAVPQRWDRTLGVAGLSPTIRSASDTASGTLAIRDQGDLIWSSKRARFLRGRRIPGEFSSLDSASGYESTIAIE